MVSAEAGLEVSLSVAPEAPCVTLDSLSAQLSAEGLRVTSAGSLDVDVSASSPGVRLRARRQDDGRLLVRAIPAREGKCEGVERAAVMLIREWARAPRLVTGLSAPDAGVPPRKERAVPVVVSPPVRTVGEEVIDAGVVLTPAPTPPEPQPGPEPIAVDAGLAHPPLPPAVVIPAATPAATPQWEVRLAVAGGFSAAATPNVVPAGAVVLDVGKGALGGSLDGALEGESVLSAAPGQARASAQWLTLAARWRFSWLERLSLDLGVGVRGSRLSATATGFTTNGTAIQLGLGPAALATFWVRLFGPVQLMVRASAALRLPAESLVVEGGPTFSIGAAHLGAVAGLGVGWP